MNELKLLKQQIEELEKFTKGVDRVQLSYPVDKASFEVLSDKALIFTGNTVDPVALASPFDECTEIITNDKKYLLESTHFFELP